MSPRLIPDLVLTEAGWTSGQGVALEGGRIASIDRIDRPAPGDVRLAGKALVPGTVNAHCHTFQSLLRGLGDDLDFTAWRDRVLYPFSQRLDRRGIALGASFAFAEMLLGGATTCVDFFYLQDEGNENAEAVIEAARAVGIRLVLARAMYDWEGAPKRYREPVADAARRTRELVAAHRDDPTTVVQPAPHSPHGASPEMIRAGWEIAETEATRFHIHVAEGRYEGERTLREHGATPIRYLDGLGVLGPRMIGVHCVWLDDEEIALMGARRAALAYCPSSNMFLGDGITRVPELLNAGVRIGLGTDGGCTNNRLSVFEEMRMTSLLQRVRLLDGVAIDAVTAFGLGTRSGAEILGLETGVIAPGRLADLVAIDLEDVSLHPRNDLLKSMVYAMSGRAVTDVWVHGRRVVESGRLMTVDGSELLAQVRELTQGWCAPQAVAGRQCEPEHGRGLGPPRARRARRRSPRRPRCDYK